MKSFSEAKWIWHNSYRGTNVYVNFEDEFTLGDAPSACSIKISCDRNYALYINGGFIDSGQYLGLRGPEILRRKLTSRRM